MRFAPIVGHANPIAHLRRAVTNDRVAGAYLLAGPAGIGKARLADAFAALLLCEAPADGEPCGACPQCVRVEGGSHPDVLRVTRDEDRRDVRIDQVRELIRWFILRPLMARRKVAVVDGAEYLNDHGQNALLKTLEEPRGAAVLVLTTAAPAALLPTVRSRCQTIRCDPLPAAAVARVLEARGIVGDRAALLAAQARGSIARALERGDESWTRVRVRVLGVAADLASQSAADLSLLAQELSRGTPEAGLLVLASWYHDVLGQVLGGPHPLENPDAATEIAAAAQGRDAVCVLRQLALVCDTVRDIERNANRVLALETMLLALREIEWTNRSQNTPP